MSDVDSEFIEQKTSSEVIEKYPALKLYLDRLSILTCFSAEDLLMTFGPADGSTVEQMLYCNSTLSLVTVDCIDAFTYAGSLKNKPKSQHPNVMALVQSAVGRTQTPVLCTSIGFINKQEFLPQKSCNPVIKSDAETFCNLLFDGHLTNWFVLEKTVQNMKMEVTTYLQTKHEGYKRNSIGNSESRRIKFTILRNMLWIVDSQESQGVKK